MFIMESGTIRYRPGFVIAFALTLGLIVASGVVAWLNARAQDRTAAVVIRVHRVLGVLNQIETTMTDAETGQRGYLLTGDEHFLEPYLSATGQGAVPVIERQAISTLLAAAHDPTLSNDTERELLRRIDGLVQAKLEELQQTINLRRAGHADQALAIVREGRGKRSMDALRATLVRLRDEEGRRLQESEAMRKQAVQRAYLSSIGGCVVALCAILLLAAKVRRAQLGLMRQEEQFQTLANNISQQAWTASSDGRFEWFNHRWQEYTGLLGGDLDVQWRQAASHPAHRERVEQGLRQAVASGRAWEDTFPLRARDGSWHWFLVRALPIRGPDGAVLRWFGTNTDIDEHLRLEDALKEANRRKDEFIATLAHELRNPLAPIQAGLELMRISPSFPVLLTRTREIMSRQMASLVRMIDDLLDVSRISTGKIELQRRRVAVRDLIDSALETQRAYIEQLGHTLSLSLPQEALTVDGDPVRLIQVLGNLLDNAAKYTPEGGSIRVEAERDGRDVVIRVIDTGIGIVPDMQTQVFDMFAQAPGGQEMRQGGVGIGLAIARQLVQMHGGTLGAHSDGLGEGSTFTLRLPLAQGGPAPASTPAPAQQPAAGPRRILVLDDNVDAAHTLGSLLGLAGHTVQLAHSGQEAIDQAARFVPDLAFLDIGLPDMSGYDVARALRAHPALDATYLVALTGWGAAADRLRSKEAGIDLHLTKPVSLDALATALPGLALPVKQGA
jgi:PAS domain S-box-containing protein